MLLVKNIRSFKFFQILIGNIVSIVFFSHKSLKFFHEFMIFSKMIQENDFETLNKLTKFLIEYYYISLRYYSYKKVSL